MLRRVILSAAACALVIGVSACARALRLELPRDTAVELKTFVVTGVEAQPRTKLLEARSPECLRLQGWLARNQHGWYQSLATNPNTGVFVTAGDLRLQFTSGVVFAFTGDGHFQKEVPHEDYAFLESAIGI